tara:strand:+ start:49 stop:537 length:489 start_codon:yes stop_codon:yes gene_type:complete
MLAIYASALPAFILLKIYISYFYARKNTKLPVRISLFSLILNLVLNLILVQYYSFLGIAIATSISSWLAIIILSYNLYIKSQLRFNRIFVAKIIKMIVAGLVMAATISFVKDLLPDSFHIDLQTKITLLLLYLTISIFSYFIFSYILRIFRFADLRIISNKN